MAKDMIPAVIKNDTADTYMVVLNGNLEPDQSPQFSDFAIIAPGESSDAKFASIDAIAVYSLKDNQPIMVEGANGSSHWWKVPDGNHGSIKTTEHGTVTLDTSYSLSGSYHIPSKEPTPSKDVDWGFKAEYLNRLLIEKKMTPDAKKEQEPMSKLEIHDANPAPAAKHETLMEYLARNHSPEESARILMAIQTQTTELQYSL